MKTKIKKINKIPLAYPNSSLANKTGAWRTYRPQTDYQKCTGCALCSKICPDACIEMINRNDKNIPVTYYDYCKGCGLCAAECPVKAIIMKRDY
ncbi:MAG: 4Fe-4S binding protein [Candidatus Falkowbacteria bacterium]|nr:4Fe-4S binding protein [Candidatus Falkowbacteria bacterium]